jgi:N,N'-diacetyllegionaminate synthase
MSPKCCIIAEAGVNHNGSLDLAEKMIDAAVMAGVDAVKFQIFRTEDFICKNAPKADYQLGSSDTAESQYEMLKHLQLSQADYQELFDYCRIREIDFLSSPFDLASIDFLNKIGLETFKIASGEINNRPLLKKIGSFQKKVILSTGMSRLGEIEAALDILESAGTQRSNIVIMHCNTEYPTPIEDVNLRAMNTIAAAFPGVQVGYSDHTVGIEVPIAAAAMGAVLIEKHFTLNREMQGPDHSSSLEPVELARMVQAIRNIEKALGNGRKQPSHSESRNILIARKSIVAARGIKCGDFFTAQNLAVKRPGGGISPMLWDEVVGKPAKKDFEADDLIEL